ncbi:MAG: cation diffusion facilitator family transporter [Succiniclasticum sp.]|uniref:cation diffusion facilitator family transporter n=1 Tax=Succiniclasticum sp. TaxID=2775030 RepID=UPI002A911416|nr:cation diffusion facilitator family transporter [Succiniclasticum sp.]MDY6289873.1 cation diffusion facilitator family transporter [Succiniclasticum sp.]
MKKLHVTSNREKIAMRISWYSIAVNVFLSLGKLAAGLLGHSAAMVSDAIHSASDVFATFIVMAGIRISGRASDDDHQYGHERLECVASILLAVILVLTGLGIGYAGINKIINQDAEAISIPTLLPLIAAIVSIVVKEAMYWYTRHYALMLQSDALMADAWHHRSDALSSVGSFIGVLGARMGFPLLDPIASVVICFMILQAGYEIFTGAVDKMVDKACSKEEEDAMRAKVESIPGVYHIDLLHTRQFGSRIFVDVEVSADDSLTLLQSHQIAESIHHSIEKDFPNVKHCMVHINPISEVSHDCYQTEIK